MLTTSERTTVGRSPSVRDDLRRPMVIVAVTTLLFGLAALGARASYGGRTTADEPQYLLTAISLAEDLDLDISDELADERYLAFREKGLNVQTIDLNDDGQRISPHEPLLPVLLALPVRVGGWAGAKIMLSAIAAITAATTLWVAVRRFGADPGVAPWIVGGCFAAPPLSSYAVQVYPAMPAALCVMLGVAAATSPDRRRWGWVGITAVIALPWLNVKYVPLAAVIAGHLLIGVRRHRSAMLARVAVLGVAAALYVVVHRRVYGGWTVYATGDFFVNGEWLVLGRHPDYLGRSRRLIGLVIDRGFGLAAWNPIYLAVPMSLVAMVKRRVGRWQLLLALILSGWAVATWVAFTMHGWWWPGRQLVPVLPLVAIAFAVWLGRAGRRAAAAMAAAGVFAVAGWLWLVTEASTGRIALIVDFEQTSNPLYRAWRTVLPDHRHLDSSGVVLTALWAVVLLVGSAMVWRRCSTGGEHEDEDEEASLG